MSKFFQNYVWVMFLYIKDNSQTFMVNKFMRSGSFQGTNFCQILEF